MDLSRTPDIFGNPVEGTRVIQTALASGQLELDAAKGHWTNITAGTPTGTPIVRYQRLNSLVFVTYIFNGAFTINTNTTIVLPIKAITASDAVADTTEIYPMNSFICGNHQGVQLGFFHTLNNSTIEADTTMVVAAGCTVSGYYWAQ